MNLKNLFISFFVTTAMPMSAQTVNVRGNEPGEIIPKEIYGQFAEHLGTCIYGGLWVGKESNIPNQEGYRTDVLNALKDLKVPVLRWPGGCFADEYHWMDGIGPKEKRPTMVNNNWGGTVEDNSFGTHEFFNLCELIGAEPYLSGNVGSGTVEELAKWVEYITSDGNSPMANLRRQNGREKSWNLKYLGVGNEQWDEKDNPAFTSRLKKFMDVLSKAHPEIKYIGTTGPDSEGWKFDMLQPKMKELGVDLYDEHFYRNEEWFLGKAKDRDSNPLNCGAMRYDSYDRKGPKVFAGEYACHGKGKKWNHFETSLYEAAFMTGFERNADIVHMCTYAPLFAHVKGWQWRPDMIWYDNASMFKTCSYYVQQLYGQYKGTNVLSCSMSQKPIAGQDDQDGLFATACFDSEMNAVIVKVANVSDDDQPVKLNWTGKSKDLKAGFKSAEQITLSATGMNDENSLDDPLKITPKTEIIAADATEFKIPAKSFQVYIFKK